MKLKTNFLKCKKAISVPDSYSVLFLYFTSNSHPPSKNLAICQYINKTLTILVTYSMDSLKDCINLQTLLVTYAILLVN